MNLPKSTKGFASLLLAIAYQGNDYSENGLSHEEIREFGYVIADIQNWLGEHEELLNKLKLTYKEYEPKEKD